MILQHTTYTNLRPNYYFMRYAVRCSFKMLKWLNLILHGWNLLPKSLFCHSHVVIIYTVKIIRHNTSIQR